VPFRPRLERLINIEGSDTIVAQIAIIDNWIAFLAHTVAEKGPLVRSRWSYDRSSAHFRRASPAIRARELPGWPWLLKPPDQQLSQGARASRPSSSLGEPVARILACSVGQRAIAADPYREFAVCVKWFTQRKQDHTLTLRIVNLERR
jgi:hypothetical protein